ncbi:acyl-CoA thioesterase domain-containing protein [Sphingopyxis sp. BSNA05]|uniref:acyl-CoA thioesterase domain-containing protein n=1 Tax=Sphingopyxis sp. BSNA05 TaxID=1236614 RepID=UPI001C267A96
MTDKAPQPIALADLLDQCGAGGPDNPVTLPQSWTQGRTAFGGLSGALAYHAASHIEADLPPLRSAQIAFTGPLFGALTAETAMLRRGKSTAFVQSEIFGDKGLGLHCNFILPPRARPRSGPPTSQSPTFRHCRVKPTCTADRRNFSLPIWNMSASGSTPAPRPTASPAGCG